MWQCLVFRELDKSTHQRRGISNSNSALDRKNAVCSSSSSQRGGDWGGAILSYPMGQLAMAGDVFGCHHGEGEGRYFWHLVGGGQGCRSTPYNVQDRPPQQRMIWPWTSAVPSWGQKLTRAGRSLWINQEAGRRSEEIVAEACAVRQDGRAELGDGGPGEGGERHGQGQLGLALEQGDQCGRQEGEGPRSGRSDPTGPCEHGKESGFSCKPDGEPWLAGDREDRDMSDIRKGSAKPSVAGRLGWGAGIQRLLQVWVVGTDGGSGQAHGTQVGSGYKGKAEPQGPVGGWAPGPSLLTGRLIKTWKVAWEVGLGGQRRTLWDPPLQ